MLFLNTFCGFLKKSVLFILIVAIAIPLRYGSTDPKYLCVRLLHSILSLKHSLIPDRDRPTLSAEYRAFENMLRMIPFPKLDPSADPLTVIKEMRSSFAMNSITPKPSQCQINKEVFEHDGHVVDGYWVSYPPKNIQRHSDKILLYFHGGGYVLGNIHSK
jgi:acetyl esterase/lipase